MNTFSKQHTQFVKGVAALLLLWHHLFFTQFQMPIREFNISELSTCLTKVCVALFTIMSGYGLTISYKNKKISDTKFVILHIKKLLINYLWVYIPVFILSFWFHKAGTPVEIYGTGFQGVLNGLIDFLGLRGITYTPTLTNTWWYMGAILVYYLLFPIIYKACKKSACLSVIVSAIPCVLIIFVEFSTTTDRELFYLLPFVVGVVFAEKNILNKIVGFASKRNPLLLIISAVCVALSMLLVTQNRLIGNTIYAVAIIVFCISIKEASFKPLNTFLEYYGKYSMDIYFVHPFLYSMGTFAIVGQFIQNISFAPLRYIALVFLALIVSIIIEALKNGMYNLLDRDKKSN